MKKKRIMILGGNSVQAEATLTAKRLGYHTISTDLHKDNPGHAIADEYCPIDIIDKAAVLREAKRLSIDGIIPYTSDVLAPVAAYVTEAMSLPGNPYHTVEIMTHKDLFRQFLLEHGFPTPKGKGFRNMDDAIEFFHTLGGTAMMKPVDSAGSKGAFKVSNDNDIRLHWQESMGYSADGMVIIEQFIERKELQQDGDIFVIDGRIAFWGVGDQHKDPIAPYVPAVLTFPSMLRKEYVNKAQKLVQEIITALGYRQGPCNVEYMVGTDGEVYVMEIGPRNGGNLIGFALQEVTDVDLTALTVQAALGEPVTVPAWNYSGYVAAVVLHAQHDGTLKGLNVPEKYKQNLRRTFMFRNIGDKVQRFHNGGDTIGSMTFRFDSFDEMEDFINNTVPYMVVVNS